MPLKSYLVALLGLGLAASSAYGTVTIDNSTKGTWKSPATSHGTDGYILSDYLNGGADTVSLPSYVASYSTTGTLFPFGTNTVDTNTLQNPANTANRNMGVYFTTTSYTITINPAAGTTNKFINLDLYMWDKDGGRAETISFTGAGANAPTAGAPDVVSGFTSGTWHSYPVVLNAGTPTIITVTNTVGGNNAVVSAVMFTATPEPASLALLGLGGVALLTRRRRQA